MKLASRVFGVRSINKAAVVLGLLLAFANTGSAAAVTPDVSVPLCAHAGQGLCLSDIDHSGAGNPVFLKRNDSGSAQNINLTKRPTYCGGTVTNNCPFNNTTYDHRFHGDKIYALKFSADPNSCVAFQPSLTNPGTGIQVAGCRDTGTNWVCIQVNSNNLFGCNLLNVWAVNHHRTDVWLHSDGHAADQPDLNRSAKHRAVWANN